MYQKNSNHSFGFTLVELLITLVVMGTAVGIGTASYVSFNERQLLTQAGKTFISDITKAKQNATVGLKDQTLCDNMQFAGWCVSPDNIDGESYKVYGSCIDSGGTAHAFPTNPGDIELPQGTAFFTSGGGSQNKGYILNCTSANPWVTNSQRVLFQPVGENVCFYGVTDDSETIDTCKPGHDPSTDCTISYMSYCLESNYPSLVGGDTKYIVQVKSSGEIVDVGLTTKCEWE